MNDASRLRATTTTTTMFRSSIAVTALVVLVVALVVGPNSCNALSESAPPKKYYGGAGVGRLSLDSPDLRWECRYDSVLVERLQGKPKTESGLYVPQEDLPKLHLGRVLSVGPGREEENGRIAPMPPIAPGDVIICKNPWGIGPKDEETGDGKKLSFMRSIDVAGVLDGKILDERMD